MARPYHGIRGSNGQWTTAGSGGVFRLYREGQWDDVGFAIGKMLQVPEHLRDDLENEIGEIIKKALEQARLSTDYEPNTPLTEKMKGRNAPWQWSGNPGGRSGVTDVAKSEVHGSSIVFELEYGDSTIHNAVNLGFTNWLGSAPPRNIYELAWKNCEGDVKAVIDGVLSSYF